MPHASCNKQLFEVWIAIDKLPHLIIGEDAGLQPTTFATQSAVKAARRSFSVGAARLRLAIIR
jgi:hypothetical protein